MGVATLVVVTNRAERRPLHEHEPLSEATLERLKQGDEVVAEVQVVPDHVTIPGARDMAFACEQTYEYDSDDDGEWEDAQPFNQAVTVRLEEGGQRFVLALDDPCPRGEYLTWMDPNNGERRIVGVDPGMWFTAVGVVEGTQPLRIGVRRHYVGSIDDYLAMLRSVLWVVPLVLLTFGGVGVYLISLHVRGVALHHRRLLE